MHTHSLKPLKTKREDRSQVTNIVYGLLSKLQSEGLLATFQAKGAVLNKISSEKILSSITSPSLTELLHYFAVSEKLRSPIIVLIDLRKERH